MNHLQRWLVFQATLTTAQAFAGLLDDADNLVAAWSPARRLLTSYTGNLVRLRRDSDDAEQAFGYDSAGELNAAAITAWAAGSDVFVVTLYDQIGSANPTQATAAAQPQLALDAQNGHAAMLCDGSDDFLQAAYSAPRSQPYHLYAAVKLDAAAVNDAANHYISDGDDAAARSIIAQYNTPNPDAWAMFAGVWTASATATDSDFHVLTALYNGGSSRLRLDATQIATGNAGAHNADGLTIGAAFNGGSPWKGYIGAVVIADPNHSDAVRDALEVALIDYWGIT